MATADVRVPKAQALRFPDQCIVCGRAAPGHQLALKSVFDGMKPLHEEVLHVWEADVPVCTEHARSLVRSRRVGKLLAALATVVAAGLLLLGTVWFPDLQGWVMWLTLAVAILGPFVAVQLLYTPLFDFSPWNDSLVFEFRSRAYAELFARLNEAEVR